MKSLRELLEYATLYRGTMQAQTASDQFRLREILDNRLKIKKYAVLKFIPLRIEFLNLYRSSKLVITAYALVTCKQIPVSIVKYVYNQELIITITSYRKNYRGKKMKERKGIHEILLIISNPTC